MKFRSFLKEILKRKKKWKLMIETIIQIQESFLKNFYNRIEESELNSEFVLLYWKKILNLSKMIGKKWLIFFVFKLSSESRVIDLYRMFWEDDNQAIDFLIIVESSSKFINEILIEFWRNNDLQYLIEYLYYDFFFYYKTHVRSSKSN